jgi:hypothetical protein
MARAYPLDLRERVVAAVLRGLACRAVAVHFDVSAASVVKKPITTASILDKERIMSGCPELSPNLDDGRDQAAAA